MAFPFRSYTRHHAACRQGDVRQSYVVIRYVTIPESQQIIKVSHMSHVPAYDPFPASRDV